MNLVEYFPETRRLKMANQPIHFDPEFNTFTYGDPTRPKAGLRNLRSGDLLIFYCGLEGWDFFSPPALYLLGYFDILAAGRARDFSHDEIRNMFSENYHVKNSDVFDWQKDHLVLVKGSGKSRLFEKAICISTTGHDRIGRPLKVLSPEMQEIFGDFDGKISLQRSPPRWVKTEHTAKVVEFVKAL